MSATEEIIDAEIVSRAAVLRAQAAEKGKTAAVSAGRAAVKGGASLGRRYYRGARTGLRSFWRYWLDLPGADDIDECEPGKREQAKASHEKKLVRNRAVMIGAVGSGLSVATSGLTDLHRLHDGPIGWLLVVGLWLALIGLAGAATYNVIQKRHQHGWLWPCSLGGVLAASVAAIYVRYALGTPMWAMPGSVAVAASIWFLVAGADGDLFGDGTDGAAPTTSDAATDTGIKSDTRYSRIVAGYNAVLKIKDGMEQITIVSEGLERFDDIWSRMRLQFPGTITNDQIRAAVPGVAAFMGISAERLDAVGIDDGHGDEIQGAMDIWLASGDQWRNTPEWPLLNAERASVWDSIPFIVTDRGVPILASALFAMWLLVAKSRHGKTFAMRLLAFVFAKDPTADYAVFDFKVGGRDWLWARKTAVACGYGNSDETVKAFLDYLLSVLEAAKEWGRIFQAMPEHLVPHGQLTKDACAYEPRLRPLGIFADEVHHALMHPTWGKDITTALSRISRELPFLAVNVFIASQRADVRTSIPSEVRSMAANRVAGKLYTSRDSGDVLGDAANDAGFNAKNLRPVKGLFIVYGTDDTSSFDGYTKGRAYLVDNVQATKIGDDAYALRQSAGVAPSAPEPPAPPEELLQAIEILRAAEVTAMGSGELASKMGTTPQRLLARIGVRSRQNPDDGYCKYVYLSDLEAAAASPTPGLHIVRGVS